MPVITINTVVAICRGNAENEFTGSACMERTAPHATSRKQKQKQHNPTFFASGYCGTRARLVKTVDGKTSKVARKTLPTPDVGAAVSILLARNKPRSHEATRRTFVCYKATALDHRLNKTVERLGPKRLALQFLDESMVSARPCGACTPLPMSHEGRWHSSAALSHTLPFLY